MPTLSHSADTDSQENENMHKVSSISDDNFVQPGPHPIELKQLPTKDNPESPTPSNKELTQLFKAYDLPNAPPLYNDPQQRQNNAFAQELKQWALHAHSEAQKQTTAFLVCGKPYEQVLEEATAEYLQRTAKTGEIVRERHLKWQAFIAGLQSGVKAFIPPGRSQAAAVDGLIFSLNFGNTNQEAQVNFLLLFQD